MDEVNHRIKNDYTKLEITIILTEACNFNCTYCYQNPSAVELTYEKADKLIKEIMVMIKRKPYKELHIQYFGGEPLLKIDIMKHLDSEFKRNQVDKHFTYHAHITTNGSLITDELLKVIEFESIQITLDGLEKTHNRLRKSDNHKFNDIIKKLDAIIPICNKILIRMNACEENSEEILPLIDFIMKRYNKHKYKISCSINHMIKYDENNDFTMLPFEKFAHLYLASIRKLKEFGKKVNLISSMDYNCSYTYGKAYCVTPNLELAYCTGLTGTDNKLFSSDLVRPSQIFDLDPKCRNCEIAPICLGGCTVVKELGLTECITHKIIIKDLLKDYIKDNI